MIKRVLILPVILLLTACLDSKDNKLQRFLIQGNDAATKQSYGEAKRYYSEALKLDSCFVDAWNNLGTVYYKEKHFAEALDAYTNALQCNPKMRMALLNRSNTYYELNKPDQAMEDVNAFATMGPDTLVTHMLRGMILTRKQDFSEAVRSFKKALTFDSSHVETLVNLGTVYYYKKNYDSARQLLNKAVQIDASEANAYNVSSLVELDNGNSADALRNVNRALAIRGNDPYFLNNRGYIFITMGDLEKALSDIDKSIAEDPYNAWAYRNKGIYYLKTNQPGAALRVLDRAVKLDTTVSKLYYYLGEANISNGDKKLGCTYLRKARVKGDIGQQELSAKCAN